MLQVQFCLIEHDPGKSPSSAANMHSKSTYDVSRKKVLVSNIWVDAGFQCHVRTVICPISLVIKSASQPLAPFPETSGVIGTSPQSPPPPASAGHLWPRNRNVFKMAVMILAGADLWKGIRCKTSHKEKSHTNAAIFKLYFHLLRW